MGPVSGVWAKIGYEAEAVPDEAEAVAIIKTVGPSLVVSEPSAAVGQPPRNLLTTPFSPSPCDERFTVQPTWSPGVRSPGSSGMP